MVTNVTVKGVECVANLTGKGALSLATFLIAALKDQKRTKGKARMRAFDGKPTKVFVIKAKDMKLFAEEAKKYGILYAAVINRKQKDGLIDVVVNANDAAKVNRIADRFALSTVDIEKIRADIQKGREEKADAEKERTNPAAEKEVQTADEQVPASAAAEPQRTEHRQPADVQTDPISARTEKSAPSAPTSNKREITAEGSERPSAVPIQSVRGEIKRITEERRTEKPREQPARQKSRQPQQQQHRHPTKQKKKSKGKGR